jgi:hypothetical protein
MTQQQPSNAIPTLSVEQQLPQSDPDATILIRLATHSFASGGSSKSEPMAWVMSQQHPFVATAKIVRMYLREDGGVDVYWSDGKMFLRTFIPERAIIFFDEVMSEDTFVAFIEQAEAEEEEPEPDDPGSEPEPGHQTTAPSPDPGELNQTGPSA